MTNVSPSAQKVDDFLSKISQLSQDRLRENQKTRRDLQSEIDVLRSRQSQKHENSRPDTDFGISQLTFNRSARTQLIQKWADAPPALPSRPKPQFHAEIPGNFEEKHAFQPNTAYRDETPTQKHSMMVENEAPSLPQRQQGVSSFKTPEKPPKPEKPRALEQHKFPEKPSKPAGLSRATLDKLEQLESRPQLPKRPAGENSLFPGLIHPVARHETSNKPDKREATSTASNFPNFVARKASGVKSEPTPGKMTSFSEIESRIRGSKTNVQDSLDSNSSSSFSSSRDLGAKDQDTANFKSSTSTWTSSLKPAKPLKPLKPTLKSFETKDTELLRDQIKRLSPTKTKQDEKQFVGGNLQLENGTNAKPESDNIEAKIKTLKPLKPVKPKNLVHEPEAVLALGNLRKSQPSPEKPAPVPEALQKFQSLKKGPPKPLKLSFPSKSSVTENAKNVASGGQSDDLSVSETYGRKPAPNPVSGSDISTDLSSSQAPKSAPSKTDFQAHLASIFRSSTAPTLGSSAQGSKSAIEAPKIATLPRPSTLPETSTSQKLTHPNKSRAKGPKRKLPKSGSETKGPATDFSKSTNLATGESRNTTLEKGTKSFGSSFQQGDAEEPGKVEPREEKDTKMEPLVYQKPKKVPPPKAKKPSFEPRQTRNFSGEVFI